MKKQDFQLRSLEVLHLYYTIHTQVIFSSSTLTPLTVNYLNRFKLLFQLSCFANQEEQICKFELAGIYKRYIKRFAFHTAT